MKFEAEIKEVKQYKAASLDNVYSIRLITDDREIMDLGKISPQMTVVVEITPKEIDDGGHPID